jgi:hypothetical protein
MDKGMDLRELLQSWAYDPEDNVRLTTGTDGRELLQVRLPLGIEQYEMEGRPDGEHPFGQESILDYQLGRLAAAQRAGNEAEFKLTPDECMELFNEGTLFYYRYLYLYQAKQWTGAVRDTARNLNLFDFVHTFAEDEEDQSYLEQWRPYLLRMNAAAEAMVAIEKADHARALEQVNKAIGKIEELDELEDETFQFERRRSLAALRELASQIEESKPVSEVELLERELRQAIQAQQFEHAAVLRDRIRALRRQA